MSQSEAPKPPDDAELRNIIDKLAQFVARNGPDFENMTKQKQKENPRFSFLFGGEYFHYYMYKVNAEQAIMRKQKMQAEQNSLSQMQVLQQQILESEKNLKLQHEVLKQQEQAQLDEAIRIAEGERLRHLAVEHQLNLVEFSSLLEQMQDSCTKEAISGNKNWFFAYNLSQRHAEIILNYLVSRVKDPATPFLFKLHMLYLVNDLTHHYTRKMNESMLAILGRFVVMMFSCVFVLHTGDDQQREKLEKLRSIWESQRYFSDDVLKKLSNVQDTYEEYCLVLRKEYSSTASEIAHKYQIQYQKYEIQHFEYAKHIQQQIAALESRPNVQPMQSFTGSTPPARSLIGVPTSSPVVTRTGSPSQASVAPRRSRFDTGPPITSGAPLPVSSTALLQNPMLARQKFPPQMLINPSTMQQGPPPVSPWQGPPPGASPPTFNQMVPQAQQQIVQRYEFPPMFSPNRNTPPQVNMPPMQGGPRPLFPPGGANIPPPFVNSPHMVSGGWNPPSGPPPTAGSPWAMPPQQQQQIPPTIRPLMSQTVLAPPTMRSSAPDDAALIPTVAYYDLPAGLMVPLVKLEDNEYRPLDPTKIRLPPPVPPSARLLAAVEAFYAPPNHENPRDSEGWERLGLYEYFKAKQNAINSNDDDEERPGNSDERRRSPAANQDRSHSRSYSSDSRSRSPSPRHRRRERSRSSSHSASSSRSRTRSNSRSSRRRERSRSNSKSRSPTQIPERRGTRSSNRNESEAPGSSACAAYQGLGAAASADPFEEYRKAQSGYFIQRLRNAAEQR